MDEGIKNMREGVAGIAATGADMGMNFYLAALTLLRAVMNLARLHLGRYEEGRACLRPSTPGLPKALIPRPHRGQTVDRSPRLRRSWFITGKLSVFAARIIVAMEAGREYFMDWYPTHSISDRLGRKCIVWQKHGYRRAIV
ncbi:hypothetical protein B5P45_18075 [Phyllobacterium zundukense]|uniref:Uncharacterized protein n=1 Tax=Phyllobacterium zundukense TaxID=1867719 RepID=A0A2N9VV99_9HYPH|nr:hypothetical protein BLM14_19755 [Phyllobacterium zundukense]PIO43417.1 hypothetical protein B5P45_18075 [Phyllobacterium zundukense]